MDKKANHQANIVRIKEVKKHPNADKLELVYLEGSLFQCISQIGTFKVGDVAVYIQPDSIVHQTEPFSFIWKPFSASKVEEGYGEVWAEVPEKRRRITAKRLRGEWSEGLLMPIDAFWKFDHVEGNTVYIYNDDNKFSYLYVGEDVSDVLGITHYDPDTAVLGTKIEDTTFAPKRKKRRPKTIKGWFFHIVHAVKHYFSPEEHIELSLKVPIYDVEGFKNYPKVFLPNEQVIVTEKIHGSNTRFMFLDNEFYAGSRKLWVNPEGSSYPAKAAKANPWIKEWCIKNPGYVLYGETTPTQKGYDYSKSKKINFWAFDIFDPNGNWLDYNEFFCSLASVKYSLMVPVVYHGDIEGALEKLSILVEGKTLTDGGHIREGIVIKPLANRYVRGLGRVQLKIVSNTFLEKDGK